MKWKPKLKPINILVAQSFKNITHGLILLLTLVVFSCVPLAQQTAGDTSTGSSNPEYYAETQLRFDDFIYDPNVKTVQCYVQSGHPEEVLTPPVIPLTQEQRIVLEFDQLNTPQQRFLVKFIYCNADWTEARRR